MFYILICLALVCNFSTASISAQTNQTEFPKTKLIILGVGHSSQLVAETYQPAVLRAFFNRIKPDAICIERSPQEFARDDFYEFTFEQQYLTIPFAREHQIPIYPIDWLPQTEDTLLAFNLPDVERPPFVRNASGFLSFLKFTDKSNLTTDLFFAESENEVNQQNQFANTVPEQQRFDFARRLFLYRTFMQSMRILRVVNANPEKTVLVIIGSSHKNNIEQILKSEKSVVLIQPSFFGHPAEQEVSALIKDEDLFAIASFNLLGTQARTGNVNWDWIKRIINNLATKSSTRELMLLQTRLQILTNKISSKEAFDKYKLILEMASNNEQFTWTGVKDKSRLDSYFDPFGNLSIRQRAQVEMAREMSKLKQTTVVEELRKQLQNQLSFTKAKQLEAYWDEYLLKTP